MSEEKVVEALKNAIKGFFSIDEIMEEDLAEAAGDYIYNHDSEVKEGIKEMLENTFETLFEEYLDEAIAAYIDQAL